MRLKEIENLSFIDDSFLLSKIHEMLVLKLNIFIGDYKKSKSIGYLSFIFYFFIELIVLIYFLLLNQVWYIKLINIMLASLIPVIAGKAIVDLNYNNVIKKIPLALDELLYWLCQSTKLNDAIRNTSEVLQGNIQRPFQTLYYNISKDPINALDTFKKTFSNKHIDTFSELLKTYITEGGNIENLCQEISALNVNILTDKSFGSKIKERFFKYKLGCLMMISSGFFMQKFLFVLLPDLGQSSTAITSDQFVFVNIYFIILFFAIDFFEYI